MVKLKFVDYYVFTGTQTLTVPLFYSYRGANCFDPIFATGGSSCTGYSDYAARYSQYIVMASAIKVLATDDGTTESYVISLIPSRTATAVYNTYQLNSIAEIRYAK